MRAISPNRQTGVATYLFSRLKQLHELQSPLKSTRGSTSPLEFGQDLVKVSVSPFEPETTFALARPGRGSAGRRNASQRCGTLLRHPALPASRLCQQMQQNAAHSLTRD